jgi:crotonobetainyl-CoA:carnitine CoA-transferase CaiB-like acyl-CoA transferase
MGNENGTAAPSGTFQTASGALNISANKQEQFETLCHLIGRSDLADDRRFAEREERKVNRNTLNVELELALCTKTAAEWEEILSKAGVPAAAVLTVPEMLASEQITSRRLVHTLPFPGATVANPHEDLRVLGNGIHINQRPSAPATTPPLLSEHTDEILTTLGYTAEDIFGLHDK